MGASEAREIVTLGEPEERHSGYRWVSVKAKCSACGYVTFTSAREDWPILTNGGWLRDHLAQHEPGRALDIEMGWEPSALCSVCTDSIGRITWDDQGDGVRCQDCGTTWDLDGTNGERQENDQ